VNGHELLAMLQGLTSEELDSPIAAECGDDGIAAADDVTAHYLYAKHVFGYGKGMNVILIDGYGRSTSYLTDHRYSGYAVPQYAVVDADPVRKELS
jgi:hypothetical protein